MHLAINWWLLENASAHDYGKHGDTLIELLHYFMFALFIGWGIFFVMCLVKFRARPGHTASYEGVNGKVSKYLEVGIVLVEVALLVGLSIPAWGDFRDIDSVRAKGDAIEVRVVGRQFQWEFHYPGKDGKFGKTSPEYFDAASNPLGLDLDNDKDAADDIWVSGVMTVPKDRSIIARISALDVIHSFGVPQLRVKQDAIPGMEAEVWFLPAKEGTYEIACSQLCGNGHTKMVGRTVVVSGDNYDKWLAEQHANTLAGEEEAEASENTESE